MNRRGFLTGLLALATAKVLPKPQVPVGIPVRWDDRLSATEAHVGVDMALAGSDQTSIYMVGWGDVRKDEEDRFIAQMQREIEQDLIYGLPVKPNWLKQEINR